MIWAYSGGRLSGEAVAEGDGAGLRVFRPSPPLAPEYPTLVDPSLVWLTLAVVPPTETAVVLRWRADGSVDVAIDLQLPAEARPGFERIAQAVVFDAGHVEPPRIEPLDVGRGAWEQAAYQAEPTPCNACPFALASNLDCPECRQVVLKRKKFASWSRARVAEGLRALDFEPNLASAVALETEFCLQQVREPALSHPYFDHFARRFEAATQGHFATREDREIARDLIEAQMVQPWFLGPHFAERALPLPLPPPLPDEGLGATARRKTRELVEAGVPRWQAERRVEGSLTLRRLLAAEGDLITEALGRGEPQIHGTLDRLYLFIIDDEGGEPWITEIASAVSREVELSRGLSEDEQARLLETVEGVHRRLMDAVAQEGRLLEVPDEGRAIELAVENLRGAPRSRGEKE
ncbi:MAG: hypothetical protein R3B09_16020 [Nannocystaceae bacterium]